MASKSLSSKTGKPTQSMASLPDDIISSVSNSTSKSGTGVLSRTSLYTPLSSYTSQQRANTNNNNNKKQKQPNIAKNVQESSLADFIATTVSSAYHLSSAGRNSNQKATVLSVKHARNTGNRPLNVGEINSRIRQRALTLVGGGYNADVNGGDGAGSGSNRQAATTGAGKAATKQAMNAAHGKRSSVAVASRSSAGRQQRRQRKKQKKTVSTKPKSGTAAKDGGGPIPVTAGANANASASAVAAAVAGSSTTTTTTTTTDTCTDKRDTNNVDMLRELHTMWLDYLWNLLGVQSLPAGTGRNDKGSNSNSNSNSSSNKTKIKMGAADTTQPLLELVRSRLPKLLLQTTTAGTGTGTPAVMELVGAKVRVQSCTRHPAQVGRTGIIVRATAEMYQIAGPPLKDAADATAVSQTRTPSPLPTIQTWIIPKRGSRVELLLPMDPPHKRCGTTIDPFSSSSSDPPQLCILLDSNQHQVARINKQ